MATFKHNGIVGYEIAGDGTQPAQTIDPDATVDTDWNPNQMYFEWVSGDPPEGAGDFNPPEQIPEPAPPQPEEPPPPAIVAAEPEE